MSDAIGVTLTPDALAALADGNPVKASLVVRNGSTFVDQYALALDGLPAEWYSLPGTSRALFPQDEEEVKLVLHVPRGGGVTAGLHPFTVSAVSRADPTQLTRVRATLEIGAIVPLHVDLSPRKVTGRKGRYNVIIRNGGNLALDVDLEARDPDDACRYGFKPAMPHLDAGRQTTVRLTVRAKRSSLVGMPNQYDFDVTARPSQGEAKTVRGQLVHTPRMRTLKPVRNVLVVAVVAAIAAIPYQQNPVKQVLCTYTAICTWLSMGKQQLFGAAPVASTDAAAAWAAPPVPRLRRIPPHEMPGETRPRPTGQVQLIVVSPSIPNAPPQSIGVGSALETPPFRAGSTSWRAKWWASARPATAYRPGRVETRGWAGHDVLPGINAGVSRAAPYVIHSYGPQSQALPQPQSQVTSQPQSQAFPMAPATLQTAPQMAAGQPF